MWKSTRGAADEDREILVHANTTVFRIKSSDDGDPIEVLVTSFDMIDRPNPADGSVVWHLFATGLKIQRASDKHRRGAGLKMVEPVTVDVEDGHTIGVRWANQHEMDELSRSYYEPGKKGAWMIPELYANDPFTYFHMLLEPKVGCADEVDDDVDNEEHLEWLDEQDLIVHREDIELARFTMLTEQYAQYTEPLVVQRKFPKYHLGTSAKGVKDGGAKLKQALAIAGKWIAAKAMRLKGELPNLDEVTDVDLPYSLAKVLGRLRGTPDQYEDDEDDGPNKKRRKAPKTPSTKEQAAPSRKTPASGAGSRAVAATKAQTQEIERLRVQKADLVSKNKELTAALSAAQAKLESREQEIHLQWVGPWKENTKSLRIAVTMLEEHDVSEAVLSNLRPVQPPFKLGESRPVPKTPTPSPVPARAPPAGSGSKKRSR